MQCCYHDIVSLCTGGCSVLFGVMHGKLKRLGRHLVDVSMGGEMLCPSVSYLSYSLESLLCTTVGEQLGKRASEQASK